MTPKRLSLLLLLGAPACQEVTLPPPPPPALNGFVNWENAPVHGLALTPNRQRLLAVNTADARLEVFDLSGPLPVHLASIPVGLDPVSVRARTDSEAWVVNHISDSVSVVDLDRGLVTATLPTGDEPADVVFAGTPARAFVSVSQENKLRIFDPENLSAAPTDLPLEGEDPRALATDGVNVYAAIAESGNRTTVLGDRAVSNGNSPYGGENPPPLLGSPVEFAPNPPRAGLILKKDAAGAWRDDNQVDWSAFVPWDVHDHDLAIVPADNPGGLRYATGLMNLNLGLALRNDGAVVVVGSDATNEIRFEPRLTSTFSKMMVAAVDPTQATGTVRDLNPHLDYQSTSVSPALRQESLSDPRAVVWSATQDLGYVAGMGSNNVIALNASGARLATIPVGQGPVGLALDEGAGRLYVLNRFDATISVVQTSDQSVLGAVGFFDPTPAAIKDGRPFLYESTRFSGLGQVSCASCHLDARMDQLAWDLGDPAGAPAPFDQVCENGPCPDFHPMKGPMATQTLQGIIGTEPLHWRGDRADLAAFAGAFVSLLGADAAPSADEMRRFEDFLATITFPPNPNRNFDGTTRDELFPNGGNPRVGEDLFHNGFLDGGLQCNDCHSVPTGTDGTVQSFIALQEPQSFKVAQLRNLYEKTGFDKASTNNNRGFGFLHDGSDDKLAGDFFQRGPFTFAPGEAGEQQRRDIEAFMFSFATDTHPAVGAQITFRAGDLANPKTGILERAQAMFALAEAGQVGIILKGLINGEPRGYFFDGAQGLFFSDRASEPGITPDDFLDLILNDPITMTVVPAGTEHRAGVDRDADGTFDRDEQDAGSDPADPTN